MACHPSGMKVDIVGLEASNNGRSCENHEVCGCVVAPDVVVRFKVVQLAHAVVDEANPSVEAPSIAVYHVTGGVDTCRIGFLRIHLLK